MKGKLLAFVLAVLSMNMLVSCDNNEIVPWQSSLKEVSLSILPDFPDGSVYAPSDDGSFFLRIDVTPEESLSLFEKDSTLIYSADFCKESGNATTTNSPDFTVAGKLSTISVGEGFITVLFSLSKDMMDKLVSNTFVVAANVRSADGSQSSSTSFVPVSKDSGGGLGGDELPGVYVSADFYDEFGVGRLITLKENDSTEWYCFYDNDVDNGVDIDTSYTMKGTWSALKAEEGISAFAVNLVMDGSSENVVDTFYVVTQNGKNYIWSKTDGLDEFYKISQSADEFNKKDLEAFLTGHLEDTELNKIERNQQTKSKHYETPPDYLSHWMEDLPDNVYLTDLSIPGSHDALSYRCMPYAMTQTESIEKQFAWGIRYFDLRVYRAWMAFKYRVYPCHDKHSCVNLCWTVVNELEKLLSAVSGLSIYGSTETAIIRLRHEGPNQDDNDTEEIYKWLEENFFTPYSDRIVYYRPDLKLGDVRGKIVVMHDKDWSDKPGHIDSGTHFTEQDNYSGQFPRFQDKKTDDFRKGLESREKIIIRDDISNIKQFNRILSFNHCSGYYEPYFPVSFSSDVYPMLLDVLLKTPETITYGIVPMDFIGRSNSLIFEELSFVISREQTKWNVNTRDLIKQIVKSNDVFKGPTETSYIPSEYTVGMNEGYIHKVYFAKGNLVCEYGKWTFTTHQYDFDTDAGQYLNRNFSNPSRFTWGYGDWSAHPGVFHWKYQEGSFTDWGKETGVYGGVYSTLSKDEWNYLVNERRIIWKSQQDSESGFGNTCQWVKYNGVTGLLIYPDVYDGPKFERDTEVGSDKSISDCVFLPAAGYISQSPTPYIDNLGTGGHYWSSDPVDDRFAWGLDFGRGSFELRKESAKTNLRSVRLVKRLERIKLKYHYIYGDYTVGKNADRTPRVVNFAEGNLTYNTSTHTWGFFEHQYDYDKSLSTDVLSNFTWGYGEWSIYHMGDYLLPSYQGYHYQPHNFTDWGRTNIYRETDGKYYTLSKDEWNYLINVRKITRDGQKESGSGVGNTCQWVTYNGVKGLIIYPDVYSGIKYKRHDVIDVNSFPYGCVFLPAAGVCDSNLHLGEYGETGFYWTSDSGPDDFKTGTAGTLWFGEDVNNTVSLEYYHKRDVGLSVRLVRNKYQ